MGDRALIRFRPPKVKVRKGEYSKGTQVHEPKEEHEPTVKEGLDEFYEEDAELWSDFGNEDWLEEE